MRFLLIVAYAWLLCGMGALHGADVEGTPAPTDAIRFDGTTLQLANQYEHDGEELREYLPTDLQLDRWTKRASIREYQDRDDLPRFVGEAVKKLNQRKFPGPASLIDNEQTGEVILDFILFPDDQSFVEFNIIKYGRRPGGGVITEEYSLRAYGDDADDFLRTLRPVRVRLVDEMAQKGLRQVQ